MLKRMTLCCVAGLMAVMTAGLTTRAQDIQSVDLPAEAKMIAQVDLQAMQASGFGKRLIEMMLDRVMEEVADRAGIGVPDINDVAGFLGFNPLEETRSITIAATDLENPESGVVGIIAMKKNIGSLEAMLPSVPGHSVKKSGGYDIHSLSPDGNTTVNLAIHTCGEGMKTLVVSASQDALTKQLARLEGKGEQCLNFKSVPGALVNLQLLEIPTESLGDGPQTIIAAMVKQISFQLTEKDNKLQMSLGLVAVNDENAEQLDQMLQGVVPMVEGQISGFAQDLKVSREGTTVKLGASMDSKEVIHLLEDQFDSAIGMIEGVLGNR